MRWSYEAVSTFHDGERTSSTRPNRSAVRLTSISSLQIKTDTLPKAVCTTVRLSRLVGGAKVRGGVKAARYCPSRRAGSRLVQGQVATERNGPGNTA